MSPHLPRQFTVTPVIRCNPYKRTCRAKRSCRPVLELVWATVPATDHLRTVRVFRVLVRVLDADDSLCHMDIPEDAGSLSHNRGLSFLISFIGLLALANSTPVFIRYLLLFVPVLVTIGLLPVADFLDNPDTTRAQKWFILGCFGFFYFAIIVFQFWSGLYMPKGNYFV